MHSAFDPRWHMPASHPVRPSLLSVVAAMILIPAIAFASPLDPSWLGGVYDGADGDDVVRLVNDLVASKSACLPDMPSPSQFYKPPFTTKPDTISSYPSCRFTRGPPLLSTPSHLPYPVGLCTSFSSELDAPEACKTGGSITLSIGPHLHRSAEPADVPYAPRRNHDLDAPFSLRER